MMRRVIVWSTVALLALIGLTGSGARTYSVLESRAWSEGPPPELSTLDRTNLGLVAFLLGVEHGTPKFIDGERQQRQMFRKFYEHPGITLMHVAPAMLFMIVAPLQFSRTIRTRYRNWHRWSGRVIVAAAIPIAASAFFFGVLMPFSGLIESAAIVLFGTVFVFALARAYLAIRAGDIRAHRIWMIRMFAVAIGVSTVRVAGTVLATITREGPETWFAASVWIGMGLTSLAAELWIRRGHERVELPAP